MLQIETLGALDVARIPAIPGPGLVATKQHDRVTV
jgi:hypothetical protein